MTKSLKLLVACCAIALAAVGSMVEMKAGPQGPPPKPSDGGSDKNPNPEPFGKCEGGGICGVTASGTTLIGKWTEFK